MGKWKYINLLVVAIVLGFMYYHISTRYESSFVVYVLSTIGWAIALGLGYYLFEYKMKVRQTDEVNGLKKSSIASGDLPKASPKDRPKVVFKKKPEQ